MVKEFCRNRTYKTKPIDHLPREYSFADGSKSLIVDYATTDQLGQCRKMIEEAALRGDNVGVDEYGNDDESIEMLFNTSEIFRASDSATGNTKAFMLIQPCFYQRSHDSCTASVYVFRTKDIDDQVYAELMSLVADFARDIDTGYTQCFTQVALCLHGLYLQLRRRGFLSVAVLPNWVNIAGASIKDNAIMVKDFGLPDRPMRSSEVVVGMLESHLTPQKVFEEYTSVDLPHIPGLPKTFNLESGTNLILRNATKDDHHLLFAIFAEAAEKGDGYSVHEFPSLNIVRLEMLATGYTAVIEEEITNRLVGFLFYHDSAMSRSGEEKVCGGSAIVCEGLRGKGLGKAFKMLGRFVWTSIGYEKLMRETFINNSRVLNVFKADAEFSVCGVLPKGGFQRGVGWVDLIVSVCEIDQKSKQHIIQETAKCRM